MSENEALTGDGRIRPGLPVAMAALVLALEANGTLARNTYREVLHQLWMEIPEDESSDDDAIACRKLLDFLA
jgi:hypothetical protein